MPYVFHEQEMVKEHIDDPSNSPIPALVDSLQERGEERGEFVRAMLNLKAAQGEAKKAIKRLLANISVDTLHAYATEDLLYQHPAMFQVTEEVRQNIAAGVLAQANEKKLFEAFDDGVLTWVPMSWLDLSASARLSPESGVRFKNLRLTGIIGRNGLRAIQRWPGLAEVQRLDLSNNSRDVVLDFVIDCPPMPKLRELRLSRCDLTELSEELVANMIVAFPNLQILDLSHDQLEDESIRRLLESDALPQLRTLLVQNNALIDCTRIANIHRPLLTTIDMADNLPRRYVAEIFDETEKVIGLYSGDTFDKDVRLLSKLPRVPKEEVAVHADSKSLSPDVFAELLRARFMMQVQRLTIYDLKEPAEIIDRLAEHSDRLVSLDELQFSSSGLDERHVSVLIPEWKGRKFSALRLSHNPVGDSGLQMVLESPLAEGLTLLDVESCKLTDRSIQLIAEAENFRPSMLSMGKNDISSFAAFRNAACVQSIEQLDMSLMIIETSHMQELSGIQWPVLQVLAFDDCDLEEEAFRVVLETIARGSKGSFPSLRTVQFQRHGMSSGALRKAVQSLPEGWRLRTTKFKDKTFVVGLLREE